MQKSTYDFETKRKYHQKLEDFVRKFYGTRLRKKRLREGMRVACFPGHEGLEILNVYDKLGIPRENIVGIERDPQVAQQIEDLKLGIRIENMKDYEFFEKAIKDEEKFDIVNLDYQGLITDDVDYALRILIGGPVIKDRSVLATNFLGNRDGSRRKFYGDVLLTCKHTDIMKAAVVEELNGNNKKAEEIYDEFKQKEAKLDSEKISNLRSDALTIFLLNSLWEGDSNLHVPEILREVIENFDSDYNNELSNKLKKISTTREMQNFLSSREYFGLVNTFSANIDLNVKEVGKRNGFDALVVGSSSIQGFLNLQEVNPFYAAAVRRGKYVSDSGAPMHFDFIYAKRINDEVSALNCAKVIFDYESNGLLLRLPENRREYVELCLELGKLFKKVKYTKAESLPEREFLGSSYKPKEINVNNIDGIEKISDTDVKLLLEAGCTPKEIIECYSGFTIDELIDLSQPKKQVINTKEEAYIAIKKLREEYGAVDSNLVREYYDTSAIDKSIPAYVAHDTMRQQKLGIISSNP
jgi:hypothetical protein